MSRQPIEYDFEFDVRFDDLDPYGHLNSTKYLDFVNTSRLLYMERTLGISVGEVAKRGNAFYMTKAEQSFSKAIEGLARIRITSRVVKFEGVRLHVTYEITSPDRAKTYSKGALEFVTMDLKTSRPCAVPEWMHDYFLTK